MACGAYYTAGETPHALLGHRAPKAPSSALICDFVLMPCLLGSAHAGEWRVELYSAGFGGGVWCS